MPTTSSGCSNPEEMLELLAGLSLLRARSNPAAEYHETSLKQQPLLRAIGATT